MIIRDKIVYVYDIEVFPNVFHCTVKNTETGVTAYCVDVLEEKVEKWEEIEDTEKDEVV